MESSYGVGVQNRFCLPDEDEVEVEDPQDILLNIEKKGDVKKEAAVSAAKKPAAKGQQGKGKPAEKNQNKSSSKPSSAGGDRVTKPRGERQDDSRDRRPQSARQNSGDGFGSESRTERGERGRGRGRGRGNGRGRGGGRREFDRRSGSDRSTVKPHEKREGSGAHNWGNPMDDLNSEGQDQQQTTWAADEERPEDGSKENVPAEGAPADGAEDGETQATEEEKTMTLDEYKAQVEKERFKSEVRVRKAGENEDQSRWKNTRVLKKTSADDEDDEEYVYEKKEQRAKHFVDLNVRFSEPARRGTGRGEGRGRGGGGRGAGRGGGRGAGRGTFGDGGRGAGRGGFGDGGRGGRGGSAPSFSMEDDFPALA